MNDTEGVEKKPSSTVAMNIKYPIFLENKMDTSQNTYK